MYMTRNFLHHNGDERNTYNVRWSFLRTLKRKEEVKKYAVIPDELFLNHNKNLL